MHTLLYITFSRRSLSVWTYLKRALILLVRECKQGRCGCTAHKRVQRPVLLAQLLIGSHLPAGSRIS